MQRATMAFHLKTAFEIGCRHDCIIKRREKIIILILSFHLFCRQNKRLDKVEIQ